MADPAADDDLPIIDCHHHLWDLALRVQPWLCEEPPIAFRYGDYRAICRDFLAAEYRAAAEGHRVAATVTMEAEWHEARLLEETRWTWGQACRSPGLPAAHVARTLLDQPDAPAQLELQAGFSFVRGIRHKPTAAPAPDRIERGARGSMSDPAWRRGYGELKRHGLHFELQAPWWHVDELLDLIAAHPETPVVINHAFLPADRSDAALAGWRAAIARAASAPQVTMKISGIGVRGRVWSAEENRGVIGDLIGAFGTGRCMFASNFPVDGLCGSFDKIYSGYKAATTDLPHADRMRLFHDNAVRVYRLGQTVAECDT